MHTYLHGSLEVAINALGLAGGDLSGGIDHSGVIRGLSGIAWKQRGKAKRVVHAARDEAIATPEERGMARDSVRSTV